MLTSFTHEKQVSGQSIWWTSAWVQMKPWRPFVRLLSRKIVSFVKRYKSVTQKLWCFVPPWSLSIWLQNRYPRQVVCTGSGHELPQRKTLFQIRKFWINKNIVVVRQTLHKISFALIVKKPTFHSILKSYHCVMRGRVKVLISCFGLGAKVFQK